jgi:hypothetical protein
VVSLRGLGTTDHAVPFQDSIRGRARRFVVYIPTAVQALAEMQETPRRMSRSWAGLGLGLGSIDQAVPFQDSIRVFSVCCVR